MSNRFLKDEKGFTGLEAAIVLIAFVVVAAVFSYVMLGAGFFTTQKSQEVVHTGVQQASSSIALSGDVIVRGFNTSAANQITFYITNTAGGTAVDLDKTILTYTDSKSFKTKSYAFDNSPGAIVQGSSSIPPTSWAKTNAWLYNGIIVTDNSATNGNGGSGNNLLEPGEKYKVVVDLTSLVTDPKLPTVNEKFTIELKPSEGAVLYITRTLPPVFAASNYYSVY
ncbi:flagellin [Methanosarcina sp. Ant1]|nr:flagellin [Methanosarcina sp. Ant1]